MLRWGTPRVLLFAVLQRDLDRLFLHDLPNIGPLVFLDSPQYLRARVERSCEYLHRLEATWLPPVALRVGEDVASISPPIDEIVSERLDAWFHRRPRRVHVGVLTGLKLVGVVDRILEAIAQVVDEGYDQAAHHVLVSLEQSLHMPERYQDGKYQLKNRPACRRKQRFEAIRLLMLGD